MGKLKPLVNPDAAMEHDMLLALNWLETYCRINGVRVITTEEVRDFLTQDDRPDLAEAFKDDYLSPSS